MSSSDIIRRDRGHEFNRSHPEDLTLWRQHGCTVPTCTDVGNRVELSSVDPEVVGGEAKDRIFNMTVSELANEILPTGIVVIRAPDGSILPTPDRVEADTFIFRQMAHGIMIPNGKGGLVEVWSFDDNGPDGEANVWPAPTIRVTEGDLVHNQLTTRRGTHTIHHHAIEPTMMNDGVGHISFEVDAGGYTYQWFASEAGTYFYHCHKNTVLHFEMGMYGFLIVDPDVEGAPFRDGGRGEIRRENETIDYDIERLWAVDELDSRWHDVVSLNVAAGIECDFFHADLDGNRIPNTLNNPMPFGPDPLLHKFDPDIFVISGIAADQRLEVPIIDGTNDPKEKVHINAKQGDVIIIRLLCAGYTTQVFRFDLDTELIEVDARTLGFGDRQQYSHPEIIPANTPFELTTARRKTLLIDTDDIAPGTYFGHVSFIDWVSGELHGRIDVPITIS